MDNQYISSAAVYLIDAVFGIYLFLVLLRFLFQLVRADFNNPISQFLVKATNPPLRPLRRIIPSIAGIDLASIVLLMIIQLIALALKHVALGLSFQPLGLFVLASAELISLTLTLFQITILAQIILSWVGPQTQNPVISLLYCLNEPIMRPARRILPPFSGFDFSPILVLIVIQLLKILLVAPLYNFGHVL